MVARQRRSPLAEERPPENRFEYGSEEGDLLRELPDGLAALPRGQRHGARCASICSVSAKPACVPCLRFLLTGSCEREWSYFTSPASSGLWQNQGMPYRVLVFARQRPPRDSGQNSSSPRAPGSITPRTPMRSERGSGATTPTGRLTPTGRVTPQPPKEAALPPPRVDGSQARQGCSWALQFAQMRATCGAGCRSVRSPLRVQVLVGNKTYVFDGAFDGTATQQVRSETPR